MKRRILVSVTNKTGLAKFKKLFNTGQWEFISTGGTAKDLEFHGIACTRIEQVTGFPEMMDGRLKTLHPKVFGGILADRSKEKHLIAIAEHGIELIDIVVVNLYDFNEKRCIERIDIGGPSLLRAAGKNGASVIPIVGPEDYDWVIDAIVLDGMLGDEARELLVQKVFAHTAQYDLDISNWMNERKGFLASTESAVH